MPKTTNKRKNDNRRNDRAPVQEVQEQAASVDTHIALTNVIPPRLLKKLRRIPRLAELERMFDEPTSSSEDINLPTTTAALNNTESTNPPIVAAPSSSNIEPDNMPSTSSDRAARPLENLPPSTDTDPDNGNNATQNINTPNDDNDNEGLVEVSSNGTNDDDASSTVNKSTNTQETYRNKFRYRGHMCMINDINVEESDTSINILLSLFQIPQSSIRSTPPSNFNATSENESDVQPETVGELGVSGVQKVSVEVQTDAEQQNLNFNRGNELQPVRQQRNVRSNVTKLSIKSGKYMLNIFPPTSNHNEPDRDRIGGDSSSENTTMSNNYGVEVYNVNNRTNRRIAGETLGDCPICLDKLNSNDLASTLCGHVFCLRCISAVVQSDNKKCPTCRKTLTKKCFHELYL